LHSARGRLPSGARFCTPPSSAHRWKSQGVNEIDVVHWLGSSEGIAIAISGARPKEVTLLYWYMLIAVAGIGFGWLAVRRRRKAGAKTA
jgi:hypothetical protein